jgi:DNA repair exonuclease SbcCD nuclease subunit
MTRVIHTGDTHLGYQQYHSPTRRQDFLDAFERVVDDAVSDDVDAVVHAGDLFHDRRPALPDLLGTLSALRRLADADVPFLAVVGNHESTRGGQWLDLFERLGLATRLGSSPVVVGDVAFYGLDHVPVSKRADLDYAFEPHDAAFAALVAHGLFTPFAHANWETETVLEEATVDFDVVLLGDNHAPGVERVDGTPVTYCGSTERVSAAERDGRGYNLVTFGESVDIRRRAVETRPFEFVPVALAEGEGEERVREQVRQHQLDGAVVVVEITGDGDPVTPAAVEQLALDEGALVARVTDRREFERVGDTGSVVEFADPDAAVRERVTELGLSPAALDVDDAVRGDVADANVRETVKRRVEERLDDVSGFEPADTGGAAVGEETTARTDDDSEAVSADAESERETNVESDQDGEANTGAEGAPAGDGSGGEAGDGDATASDGDATASDGDATASDGDTTAVVGERVDVDDAAGTTETTDGPTDGTEPDTSRAGAGDDDGGGEDDGQVSMEDFL